MHVPWKLWSDAWHMGLDAQRVIAMRLVRISAGGAKAEAESRRMVSEKIAAVTAAQMAAATALASGKGIEAAASAALRPVKKTVRANQRRLSLAKGVDSVTSRWRRVVGVARRYR
jgi:hypothetical protein